MHDQINQWVSCYLHGLTLTEADITELVELRGQALRSTGRVEFGGGILPKLIRAFCKSPNIEEALHLGQEILESRLNKAKSMLELINATAPQWQTECRWEALRYLRHYLEHYDHLHLAHKGPDDLFYPILISPPEGIQGIDSCLFYLNILWIENQIMAGVPDDVLEQFWDRLPAATLNQCEHLLINGIGKALLGTGIDPLVFEAEEHMQLVIALMRATENRLKDAAKLLCQWLNLKDENARMYVEAVVPQLAMWIGDNVRNGNLDNLFI